VHEAYFAESAGDLPEKTGHSCLINVAQLAAAAAVRRLILVHVDPHLDDDSAFDLDAGRKIFAPLELGRDGMELVF
jgi:ribonuclease BN (tRNA processing enzyme)